MTRVETTSSRPSADTNFGKRADAARNRERIIAAASALYATEGLNASMAAIARQAGVGKATLSRHFPTPETLINSVFAQHMAAYVQATEDALAMKDPWWGFVNYITQVCQMQAEDRGFAAVLTFTFTDAEEIEQLHARAYQGFLTIISRARETGHLREDFASEDLLLVLISNAAVIAATGPAASESWQRLVGHFLRGFAVPGAPLPQVPPAPSSEALYQAMNRKA